MDNFVWKLLCLVMCEFIVWPTKDKKLLIWQNQWSKTDSENIQIQKRSRLEPAWSNTKSTKTMVKSTLQQEQLSMEKNV